MASYMDAKQVREKLHLDSFAYTLTDEITAMLTKAYNDGIDNALEEIREGRYADEGYTYDENIKAKLEEAHRAGYEDGKADGFNQAGRELYAREDVETIVERAKVNAIREGRRQMAAEVCNHAEVV